MSILPRPEKRKVDSPAGLEKRNQVGQLLGAKLLVKTGGHDRDAAGTDLLDIGPGDSRFLIGPGHEQNFVRGLVAKQAIEDLAIGSSDRDRFIAANQAGTGIDDR